MSERRFSVQSVRGLAKNLYIYLLTSVFCGVYKRLNAVQLITGILNYSAADYSWYIEMYIGLFLLSPLLNQAYHGFPTKREKQMMVCVLLSITALPDVINLYAKIVPAWWTLFYPVTYYYLGCYLREFPLQLGAKTCAGIFLLTSFLLSTAHYVSLHGKMGQPSWLTFGSLYVVILSVTAFSLIKELPTDWIAEKGRFLLAKVSELSLGAYLVSAAVDQYVYSKLNTAVPDMPLRLNYFPIVVPFTIIVSYMISTVLQAVCDVTFPKSKKFHIT